MTWVATGYAFKDDPHHPFSKGKNEGQGRKEKKRAVTALFLISLPASFAEE